MSELRSLPEPYPRPVAIAPRNGFGVAALVLGIVGICVGIVPVFIGLLLSFVPVVLAITFGICGIVRANRIGGLGFGPSLAGLVVGAVTFLLWFTGYGLIW